MLTVIATSLISALIFAGIWRIFCGPEKREQARDDARVVVHVSADYETLRRIGAEMRALEEVDRLNRAFANGFEERAHKRASRR